MSQRICCRTLQYLLAFFLLLQLASVRADSNAEQDPIDRGQPGPNLQCPSSRGSLIPGVGFHFEQDYVTAAIHYANGTIVNVAKIEGTPAYKDFMRPAASGSTESPLPPESEHSTLCHLSIAYMPDFIPRAMECTQEPYTATVPMLQTLQHSVETYLRTPFCFADFTVPDWLSDSQKGGLSRALMDIGLRQASGGVVWRSSYSAIIANKATRESYDERCKGSEIILTIGYNRAGLELTLHDADCDATGKVKHFFHQDLGSAPPSETDHEPPAAYWARLKEALEEAVTPPFGKDWYGNPLPTNISTLILHGESTYLPAFHEVLVDVLGPGLVKNRKTYDPVFAPAAGAAELSFGYLDGFWFRTQPAWGCKWRSGLYWRGYWAGDGVGEEGPEGGPKRCDSVLEMLGMCE